MLYIGTDNGIYRWFRGAPWPVFHSLQGKSIVEIASPGRGTLAAIDSAGSLWATANNGLDWSELPLPHGNATPRSLAVVGEGPRERLALTTSGPAGLFVRDLSDSADANGMSGPGPLTKFETAIYEGARSLIQRIGGVGSVAVADAPANQNQSAWSALAVPNASAGPSASAIRSLAAVSSEPTVWFASVPGAGLWRSRDCGSSWSACDGLPREVYTIRSAGGVIVLGTGDGVRISHDVGETWSDASDGLKQAREVRAIDIKPGNPKILLAGAATVAGGDAPGGIGRGCALYESKDGGKTWNHVKRGFPELLEWDQIADIRFSPGDPDYALVAMASGECWATNVDGAWWEPAARKIQAARCLCAGPS